MTLTEFKHAFRPILELVSLEKSCERIINKHIGYNLGDEKSLEEEIKALISFKTDSNDNE